MLELVDEIAWNEGLDQYDKDQLRLGMLDSDLEIQELLMEYELLILEGKEDSSRFNYLENYLGELYCPEGCVPDPI